MDLEQRIKIEFERKFNRMHDKIEQARVNTSLWILIIFVVMSLIVAFFIIWMLKIRSQSNPNIQRREPQIMKKHEEETTNHDEVYELNYD